MNSQPSTLIVQMMGLPKIQLIMNNLIVTLLVCRIAKSRQRQWSSRMIIIQLRWLDLLQQSLNAVNIRMIFNIHWLLFAVASCQ